MHQAWVETEIKKLLGVVRTHGQTQPGTGRPTITFGVLFDTYAVWNRPTCLPLFHKR